VYTALCIDRDITYPYHFLSILPLLVEGLFMSLTDRIISLPYEASLVKWAGLFAHLPGFAYLDSGNQTGGNCSPPYQLPAIPCSIIRVI
jgi:hypothetical protein